MTVFKQSKPVALLSAIACAVCLTWAVSASAMDDESMSHDQKMSQGDSMNKDSMSEGDSMKKDGMSEGDSMKKDSMSEGDSMKKDGMSEGDSMKKKKDNM